MNDFKVGDIVLCSGFRYFVNEIGVIGSIDSNGYWVTIRNKPYADYLFQAHELKQPTELERALYV